MRTIPKAFQTEARRTRERVAEHTPSYVSSESSVQQSLRLKGNGYILGIDPGSRVTGYGLIKQEQNKFLYVTSGCIRTPHTHLAERLCSIYNALAEIISHYRPMEAAIENVFMHRNVSSALKLGHARGAAMIAVAQHSIPIAEYSARHIKQAVVGYGAATKEQVQHMVLSILNLQGKPQADAADALAVALCHAHSQIGVALNMQKRKRSKRSNNAKYLVKI